MTQGFKLNDVEGIELFRDQGEAVGTCRCGFSFLVPRIDEAAEKLVLLRRMAEEYNEGSLADYEVGPALLEVFGMEGDAQ